MVLSKLNVNNTANRVVLTDGDEEAMELLHRNLADPYNDIDPSRVKATFLRWNEDLEIFDAWCRTEVDDPIFDMIVAGDVMYKKELPALFFETAKRYLSPVGGILWLCHVPRSTVSQQVVKDAAVAAGFHIEAVDTSSVEVNSDCPKFDLDRAVVYRITR